MDCRRETSSAEPTKRPRKDREHNGGSSQGSSRRSAQKDGRKRSEKGSSSPVAITEKKGEGACLKKDREPGEGGERRSSVKVAWERGLRPRGEGDHNSRQGHCRNGNRRRISKRRIDLCDQPQSLDSSYYYAQPVGGRQKAIRGGAEMRRQSLAWRKKKCENRTHCETTAPCGDTSREEGSRQWACFWTRLGASYIRSEKEERSNENKGLEVNERT